MNHFYDEIKKVFTAIDLCDNLASHTSFSHCPYHIHIYQISLKNILYTIFLAIFFTEEEIEMR